jgi:hypothetical protein
MKKPIIASIVILAIGAGVSYAGGGGGAAKTNVHNVGWYDSFADAQKEAKKQGKPILFLSMFGKLDENMPCANARTLRATLFKDPDFKQLITKDVVPAWEMVRAVPKIKIDLGDGKEITRTVRGNAVLYLCNSDGKVIDAYPGIYTKDDFIPMVKNSIALLAKASDAEVIAYHQQQPAKMLRSIPTTASKMVVESPTLNVIGAPIFAGAKGEAGTAQMSKERRDFLTAARRVRDLSLTPATPEDAVYAAIGKPRGEMSDAELAEAILKADSKRNVEQLRGVIHLWFASEKTLPTPKEARDTVLETILKIPYKDPYFGLKDVLLPGTPY